MDLSGKFASVMSEDISSIQVQYGTKWAIRHGRNTESFESYTMRSNEYITRVEVRTQHSSVVNTNVVSALRFTTNLRPSPVDWIGVNITGSDYVTGRGRLRYIAGNSGHYLDGIKLFFDNCTDE
ncbi:hypothetical protein CAPTEDRAFT_204503 [Capitella teleta]|uniref:Jacalin-type lectin domain-containing protein n=1 Tax=Capitella teleta TaxID=283909 RepID=R7U3V7_CAPTE|nr:hypothetical protein CAPTEDRAFT_204503 [Capitella teleta]|eukprot:ELT98346.1 hypothetical protein CAPTEDRAFT_204503 [Capitella teleta]